VTTLVQPPSIPANVTSTARTANSVTLTWDAAVGATGYELQYKKATDSTWTTASYPGGTSATVAGLTANTDYNFRVQATNTGGSSGWSSIVNVTTQVQPPTSPTGFMSSARTSDSVTLTWNPVTTATGYVVQYKKAAETEWITAPSPAGTSLTITGLAANTAYMFRIQAFNDGGASAWPTINATTLAQSSTELVIESLVVPESARIGSTVMVSWNVTNDGDMTTSPSKWVDNIYLSPDGTMENAVLVGSFKADFELAPGETRLRMECVWIRPNMATGDYSLIVETVYDGQKSEPVFADMLLFDGNYTPRLVMPDVENVHWTIIPTRITYIPESEFTLSDLLVDVRNEHGQIVFQDALDYLDGIEIVASSSHDSDLTVNLSMTSDGWNTSLESLVFTGNPGQRNSLSLIGTCNDDVFEFHGHLAIYNELQLAWSDVNLIVVDAQWPFPDIAPPAFNTATLISEEFDADFAVSDNLFVMTSGGQRLELINFNAIEAIAPGRNDKTTIFAENNSLIVMNDTFVERRAEGQNYRVWYSEQVTAINMGGEDNTILHYGSRGGDIYSLAQGYGIATNAVGSYYHEFFGFENVMTPLMPIATSAASQPMVLEMAVLEMALQTPSPVTLFAALTVFPAAVSCGGQGLTALPEFFLAYAVGSDSTAYAAGSDALAYASCSEPDAVSVEQPPADDHWDDNLYAFLAEEQVRSQRRKDRQFGHDNNHWLAEFEKLALLDLRK
jgi:hypothetical protein